MTKLYDKDEVFFEVKPTPEQNEVGNGDEVVTGIKESTLDSILENVKKTFDEDNKATVKKREFFTTGKAKFFYDLSNTSLSPSKLTLTGGSLSVRYTKQIEDIVFNGKETINPDDLVPLLVLVEQIKEGRYPIKITYSGYNKILPVLVSVLNKFVKENKPVLEGIYHMFSHMQEVPAGEKNE